MILLLDIGNTFLKWACLDDGAFVEDGEILHADEDELADAFAESWADLDRPSAVYAANVAGEDLASELDSWLNQAWQINANYVEPAEEAFGVRNAYQEPQQLGVDRWLAMIAAWNQQRGPVCVIDCGTALTVDAVGADGQHLGGLIVPGLGMMRDSLLDGAQGIDYATESEVENADSLLAHNTRGGVEYGSLYTILAFIDRVSTDLQRELGDNMQCILTGGDAPDILPLLARDVLHQPHLVLEGLAIRVTESE